MLWCSLKVSSKELLRHKQISFSVNLHVLANSKIHSHYLCGTHCLHGNAVAQWKNA